MLQQFNSMPALNVKKEFQFNLVNGVFKFDDFFMTHSLFIDVLKDMELVKDEKENELANLISKMEDEIREVNKKLTMSLQENERKI